MMNVLERMSHDDFEQILFCHESHSANSPREEHHEHGGSQGIGNAERKAHS